ncbi:hypothetical protein COCOBI_01-6220 [Coccomyxa sp. Obi]|nr:hypothetical protein COCOBI_01-6220 [Coccomyxa sp. Obi]
MLLEGQAPVMHGARGAHLLQPAFLAASSSHANRAFPYPLPLCAGNDTKSATYMYLHGMLWCENSASRWVWTSSYGYAC